MNENLRVLKPFIRGLPLIVFTMVLAVLAARKYTEYVTPTYECTAKLKLADMQEGVPGTNMLQDMDASLTANKIATEIEVIKSSSLISRALDSLDFSVELSRVGKIKNIDLYDKSPITIVGNSLKKTIYGKNIKLNVVSKSTYIISFPGYVKSLSGIFGQTLYTKLGNILINRNDTFLAQKKNADILGEYNIRFLSKEMQIAAIKKSLDITSVDKEVAVLRIAFKSSNPVKAAAFVNMLAKAYIFDYIETKYETANVTMKFLSSRIDDVSTKLSSSENIIQQYRDKNSITNIPQETQTDYQELAQLKLQLAYCKMNLDAVEEINRYVQSGQNNFLDLAPNFEAFTDPLSTEIVKNIKVLEAQKKDLLLTLTPEHERVKVIDKKIADLAKYLTESIANTKRNNEIKYARLAGEIAKVEQTFTGIPEKEKVMNILNRDFMLIQKSYNFLNEKRMEAEIAQAAKISFHKVIEPAIPDTTAVSPNRLLIVCVAAFFSFLFTIILIYVVHSLKAKVNDVATIELNSDIPVLATLPMIREKRMYSKYFHTLLLSLDLKGLFAKGNVISLVSWNDREGKKFITSGLMKGLIKQGRHMLLLHNDPLLQKEISLLSREEQMSLQVIKIETESANLSALRASIEQYKGQFDLIMIKADSLKKNKDAILFLSLSDEVVFIMDSRITPARYVSEVNELRDEYSLARIWFILNRAGYSPNILTQLWYFIKRLSPRNSA